MKLALPALFAALLLAPAVFAAGRAMPPGVVSFAGFDFGSTNRTYDLRPLGVVAALNDWKVAGWYDHFHGKDVIADLDFYHEGRLGAVRLSLNGLCTDSQTVFQDEIHQIISILEKENGGTLYGWPAGGFVNVDPPAPPSPKGFPLHDLWNLAQGEFGKFGLRRYGIESVSDSGIMIEITLDIPGRWMVYLQREGVFRTVDEFRAGMEARLTRSEIPVVHSSLVFGENPPPRLPKDEFFVGRVRYFTDALNLHLDESDTKTLRWRPPAEVEVQGRTYLLCMETDTGFLVEKNTDRRLQTHVRISESACEADSIRAVFARMSNSSMPDDMILRGVTVTRTGDLVLIGPHDAIRKNITVHVDSESDSLAFAEAILKAGEILNEPASPTTP